MDMLRTRWRVWKMKLAFQWIAQEGLSVVEIMSDGKHQYLRDKNGTMFRLGRRG